MKKRKKSSVINIVGLFLIVFAGLITNSASLLLIGEITPPKSLLDK